MTVPQGYDVPFRLLKTNSSPNFIVGNDVLDRSIKTIIRTYPGERVYRPTFGSVVKSMIFENMTEGAALQAADEVNRAVSTWEQRVTIDNILFELDDTTIMLTINWRANGSQQDSTTSIEFRI